MKRTLYFLSLWLLLGSCGEFLEPVSRTQFVPETAESLQEMLLGNAYPVATTAIPNSNINSMLVMLDPDVTYTDFNYVPTMGNGNDQRWTLSMYIYSPDLADDAKEYKYTTEYDMWKTGYSKILGCNAVFDYLGSVSGSDAEKDYIRAQAHALRGFYYFHLVNLYGPAYSHNPDGMGMILKLDSYLEQFSAGRNTVRETYDQVVKDLTEAERYFLTLPEAKQFSPDYMVNLPMVQLLLSRVYLYMENWSDAALYANKVIKDWKFRLIDLNSIAAPPEFKPIVTPTTSPYYSFNTYVNSPENIWFWGTVTTYVAQVARIKYGTGTTGEKYARYMLCASQELLDAFADGDLRKTRYIITEEGAPNATTPCAYTALAKIPTGGNKKPQTGATTYSNAFRLSEAYLNAAEALAMLHKKSGDSPAEVYRLINDLHEKRFAPEKYADMPALTGDALIDYVRNERRLEFCLEGGNRFFDLRRWGLSFNKVYRDRGVEYPFTMEANDPCLTLPLPFSATELNTKVFQNPRGEVKLKTL